MRSRIMEKLKTKLTLWTLFALCGGCALGNAFMKPSHRHSERPPAAKLQPRA